MSFATVVERTLKGRAGARLAPVAAHVNTILFSGDDRSVSGRVALITFAARIVSAIILYVSQVLLARWMGDFEYGVFVVVWVAAVILGSLGCLGIHVAVLRFVPEYGERGQMPLLRGIIVGSRVQGLIAATVLAALAGLGLYAFGDQVSSYYLIPLYLGAVTLPMMAIGEIQDGLARAFNWANLAVAPTYIIRPLLILAGMGLAVAAGATPDAVTAMAAVIAATYLTTVGQLIWLRRRTRAVVPPGPRQYQPMRWIVIALPMFVVEGFFFLLTNVDVLIVGRLMQPDQAAVYYAATRTLALVNFVYFAVRTGGARRFSQYHAAGDSARLAAFARATLHWTFWPSLAMVAFLTVAGKPLLLLFGPTFGDGYPLLLILSVGLLARASIGPAETLLVMAGQQRVCAVVYLAAFLLNVILNFALIPILGLVGAATATMLVLVGETLALYAITASRLSIRCFIVTALWPARPAAEAA